jgi:hypothetical protein
MRTLRLTALVFLLALGAHGAFATSGRATAHPVRQEAAKSGGLLHQLQGFLVSLWSPAGCILDPLGHSQCLPASNATSPQAPAVDAGCVIGPLGRCAAQR